jgi:hypothetical protein
VSDPNDIFEITQEVEGSQTDTKLVGFHGTWFSQEDGKRIQVEGHFQLVQQNGWKIDDMVFTGVEGVTLPGPISLVDEFRRSPTLFSPAGSPKAMNNQADKPLPPKSTKPSSNVEIIRAWWSQAPAWEKVLCPVALSIVGVVLLVRTGNVRHA